MQHIAAWLVATTIGVSNILKKESCYTALTCKAGTLRRAPTMSNKILVYNDEGTSSVDVLVKSLDYYLKCSQHQKNHKLPKYKITLVCAEDVKNGSCFENTALFVMPGGRDLPYVEKLEGEGIANIQNFVESGGCYLGLCAGAYFAAKFCEFEKGTKMEVCGSRDLGFFPGKAQGCVFPGFQYGSEKGSSIVSLFIQKNYATIKKEQTFPCYYNGGCEFVIFDSSCGDSVEVIANYKKFPDKVAIVLCKVGQGKALLSGVHPEMDYQYIDKLKFTDEKLEVLEKASEEQRILFHQILQLILE